MAGRQKIYVDFTIRDPDGRLYVARLEEFSPPPELGLVFTATDFDEFDVECQVVAIDHDNGRVLHRPVDTAAVPGTAALGDSAAASSGDTPSLLAERATADLVFQ
jgi:hypothetical protein